MPPPYAAWSPASPDVCRSYSATGTWYFRARPGRKACRRSSLCARAVVAADVDDGVIELAVSSTAWMTRRLVVGIGDMAANASAGGRASSHRRAYSLRQLCAAVFGLACHGVSSCSAGSPSHFVELCSLSFNPVELALFLIIPAWAGARQAAGDVVEEKRYLGAAAFTSEAWSAMKECCQGAG
jgi:hypothetical protein